MAKGLKIFYVKDKGYYSGNSKKEVAEFLKIPTSRLALYEDPVPENEKIISIPLEIKKQNAYNDLARRLEVTVDYRKDPTRTFDLNEVVDYGSFKSKFRVTGIFDKNQIYLIENETGDFRFVYWHNIFKTKDKAKENIFEKDPLRLNFYQSGLSSLFHRYYYFGIEMNPEYQRDLVWTDDQKVKLIESVDNGLDIGKFVFVKKGYSQKYAYEILDGKQRLSALIEFYEDRFPYKGKYFSELSGADKHRITDLAISIADLEGEHLPMSKVIDYFIKLNNTGVPVDKDFLNKLSKSIQ